MGEVYIYTLTMGQYLVLTRGNQASGMVRPAITNNVNFKNKSQFIRELREDTFLGNKNDNAHEHVERVLDIVGLFNTPGVTPDVGHNGSKRTSSGSSDEIAAITSKLDSLGRDMKKLKENVHAIQVGCGICKGAHLNKDFPLNEEIKKVEEVKYGEAGNNGGNRYRMGLPGYYTRTEN
ncbi:hypothetical protein Tco_1265801 [Tanacetum coccineum]